MTDEQNTTQEEQKTPFDMDACMAMMQEMMTNQGEGTDSSEIVSRMSAQKGCSCMEMMSSIFQKSDEEDSSS